MKKPRTRLKRAGLTETVLLREFIANLSHELRTPVTAIKGFAQTLKRGGLDDRKNRMSFVNAIERHADRMKRLIEDLQSISNPTERPGPRVRKKAR